MENSNPFQKDLDFSFQYSPSDNDSISPLLRGDKKLTNHQMVNYRNNYFRNNVDSNKRKQFNKFSNENKNQYNHISKDKQQAQKRLENLRKRLRNDDYNNKGNNYNFRRDAEYTYTNYTLKDYNNNKNQNVDSVVNMEVQYDHIQIVENTNESEGTLKRFKMILNPETQNSINLIQNSGIGFKPDLDPITIKPNITKLSINERFSQL